MCDTRIGVDVDDLGLPPKAGFRRAADLKFRCVEFGTASGDLAPANLSHSARRHLVRYVEGLGLELSALTADNPRLRLTDPQTVDQRVQYTCQVLELAAQLRVPTITAAAGVLTHPETGEPSPMAIDALRRIGEFADTRGIIYALRPSVDSAEHIARVLDVLACPAFRIGLDPASAVMAGNNPVALVERCAGQVALVHARDGTAGVADRTGNETRLGDGEVDLLGVLAALAAVEYDGAYIVRRTETAAPTADLQRARELLRTHMEH